MAKEQSVACFISTGCAYAVLADVEAAWAKREAERRQRKEGSLEKLVAAFLDPHRKGRAFYATTLKAPLAAR